MQIKILVIQQQHQQMSWANVVKRNTPTATTATTAPTTATTAITIPEELLHREIALTQESLTKIEKEDQAQCRPTWVRLQRPDAPSAVPVFKTREELNAWDYSELLKNQKYSDEVFERRTQEWRIKNNWLPPPMKTTVSQDEMRRGFYLENNTVAYLTPFRTDSDLHLHENMIEMLWCLIHSRSDELVACSTVADFKAMFERNVHLEPDLRHAHVYSRRKDTFPLKMLWLISQKANVFPGKARPGICTVQQLKQNGDAATIRWLLSAKQLREMERVEFVAECSPFRESIDYDSDY